MKNGNLLLLLTGMTLVFGAHAGEPASTTQDDSGMSGRIKAIDPVTGKSRQPTAAEIASLRARASSNRNASAFGAMKLPKTHAEAARMVTILPNGAERLPASEDSFSMVVQTRQADGSFTTQHVSADGHAVPAQQPQEKASE